MAGEKNSGMGWLVAAGVGLFFLGRESREDKAPPAQPAPAALIQQPTAPMPEPVQAAPDPEPVEYRPAPVYTPPPQRFTQRVYYRNCSAARAAGAAPVRIGDPGYAPHLDRDNDGVGCE